MAWARRRLIPLAALMVATVLVAGCGGGSSPRTSGPSPTTLAPGYRRGPGGIAYQWPPPVLPGAASPASFCRLLIDDYQHLKTAQQVTTVAQRVAIVQGYVAFSPTLMAAAPAAIAPAVRAYVVPITALFEQLVATRFDLGRVPPATLAALRTAAVVAGQNRLVAYAGASCHYDLPANSTAVPSA